MPMRFRHADRMNPMSRSRDGHQPGMISPVTEMSRGRGRSEPRGPFTSKRADPLDAFTAGIDGAVHPRACYGSPGLPIVGWRRVADQKTYGGYHGPNARYQRVAVARDRRDARDFMDRRLAPRGWIDWTQSSLPKLERSDCTG